MHQQSMLGSWFYLFSVIFTEKEMQKIIVVVKGTVGIDRWTAESMFFYRSQIDNVWAGDTER